MTVVTRFAPSPTGMLHIGNARTGLFNWFYAKHMGGKFLLRIEDTDRKRSTMEAIDAILDGMKWLGLDWDGEAVFQSKAEERHKEIAHKLLAEGKAYKCYCTAEELTEMREQAQAEGCPFRYDGRWRDRPDSEAPEGAPPAIRLKTENKGEMVINDQVQGEVRVPYSEIDDFILLRSDGTPTYMLAVVVDDHDMGVTHIIRGNDHLTNAFRQKAIYDVLGWDIPQFAHIPLIHGPDGAKLSKRHGALGVGAYRDMGYLPEAMRNYLLRLGWSHGDDEIISTEQAIEWFDFDGIGKSPSRFDFDKLDNLNGHYIRACDDAKLAELILPFFGGVEIDDTAAERIRLGMAGLKERAKNLVELAESAVFYIKRPEFDEKARKVLDEGGAEIISGLLPALEEITDWNEENIKQAVKDFAEEKGLKLGKVAPPLRAALTASTTSPGIFDVTVILGQGEVIARLDTVT